LIAPSVECLQVSRVSESGATKTSPAVTKAAEVAHTIANTSQSSAAAVTSPATITKDTAASDIAVVKDDKSADAGAGKAAADATSTHTTNTAATPAVVAEYDDAEEDELPPG